MTRLLLSITIALAGMPFAGAQAQGMPQLRNVASIHGIFGGLTPGYGAALEIQRSARGSRHFSCQAALGFQQSDFYGVSTASGTAIRYLYRTFTVMPGFRYHPLRPGHRLDPTIGLQLATGLLTTDWRRTLRGASEPYERDRYRSLYLAPQLELALNLHLPTRLVVGCFVSAGPVLSGKLQAPSGGVYQDPLAVPGQVGLRLGGMF